jgi:hypothetical protein
MSAVIAARDKYKDLFEKKHGVRLGFMGFFAKAACLALKDIPGRQRPDRGRRDRLSRLCRHLGRGFGPQRPGRAGGARCRQEGLRPDRKGHRRLSARARTAR